MSKRGIVQLSEFDNRWYDPGRPAAIRVAWTIVNGLIFLSWFPWPSRLKVLLLRIFGARVGKAVVIKPRVNIKYPWNLSVGDHAWIGEAVWLDSVGRIDVGANACLSQGVMVETGNHDWTKRAFDLLVKPVVVEEGAWAAVGALLLPGSRLASHAVLGARSVLAGVTEPYGVYVGVPATLVKQREVGSP